MRAALIRAIGHRPLVHLRPLGDRKHDRPGFCSVCGANTTFAFNSWVVPADMKSEWSAEGLGDRIVERETMYCRRCFASLRVRRIAEVLLLHYAEDAESASALVDEAGFRELDVAEINGAGALHSVLARHPRLRYSEFRKGTQPGAVVGGVPSEDVCRLTYADASFNLVLTADTLEHVPDYELALRELRRVLRVGGRHIFTVPAVPTRQETLRRVRVDESGELRFSAPAQYHGRGSGLLALATPRRHDFLAYTDFGLDLIDRLSAASFRAEVHFYRESAPESDAALVFCAEAV